LDFFIVRQEAIFSREKTCCPECSDGFLVGVRLRNPFTCYSGEGPLGAIPDVDEASVLASHQGERRPKENVSPSVATGESFPILDGSVGTAKNMAKLVPIGLREHWLIDPNELQIFGDGFLGEGAFGVVMAGCLHGTHVAVKLPSAKKVVSAVRSLANEIRILRRIRHPHIVLFHGVCVAEECDKLALVFERVQGTNLKSFIISKPPLEPAASHRYCLVLDICEALRYLHGQNPQVVHGDVKAENIMVDNVTFARPRAKMLDFGLSRLVSQSGGRLGGTLPWMAPEVLLGSHPDTSADVFSFGHLLIFIMSGQSPCQGMKGRQLRGMAKKGQTLVTVPPRTCYKRLCELLCKKCCLSMPAARPSMATIHVSILEWNSADTDMEVKATAAMQPRHLSL